MKNFDFMTPSKINYLVAIEDDYDADWVRRHPQLVPDYCNDPESAFPIMLQHNIAILPTGLNGVWVAIHSPDIDKDNKIHANILEYDENPLVAAMICFLKVMEVKHERQ